MTFALKRSFLSPEERVRLLTSIGADCNLPDRDGHTPLEVKELLPPIIEKKVTQFLVANGADQERYETYKALKGVAHSWTLEGEGKIYNVKNRSFQTVPLTELDSIFSLKLIRQLLQAFVDEQMKQMGSYYQTFGEKILKVFDRSLDCYYSHELLEELIRSGENEPLLLAGGTDIHGIGIVVCKNRIYLCNRGGRKEGEEPGIKEFIFNRGLQTELESFIEHAIWERGSFDDFYKRFDALEPLLKRLICQSEQKVGNCSWANLESGLLALLIILTEAQTPEDISLCRAIYKAFTKFAREKLLLAYLEVPKPDPSVLRQIENKLGEKNSPFSEEEKTELIGKIEEKISCTSFRERSG